MMSVLYMMDGCPVCAQVLKHLNEHRIQYEKRNIIEEYDAREKLKKLTGEVYVPVFVHDQGILVGRNILRMKS
ncbi:glutaredoxin [Halobacillus fulvus]|nr:glutaredoxin [Halobacillus fulvus]